MIQMSADRQHDRAMPAAEVHAEPVHADPLPTAALLHDLGHWMPAAPKSSAQLTDIRMLEAQLTRLAAIAHEASIGLEPGPLAFMRLSPVLAGEWPGISSTTLPAPPRPAAAFGSPSGAAPAPPSRSQTTALAATTARRGWQALGCQTSRTCFQMTGGHLDIIRGPSGGTVAVRSSAVSATGSCSRGPGRSGRRRHD
jgi:hypothetical protein